MELRVCEPRLGIVTTQWHQGTSKKVTAKSRPKERDRQMYIYQSMTGHMDAYPSLFP